MEEPYCASGDSRHISTSTLTHPPTATTLEIIPPTSSHVLASNSQVLEERHNVDSMHADSALDSNESAIVFEDGIQEFEADEEQSIRTSGTIRSRSDTSGSYSSSGSGQVDWVELERNEEQAPRDEGSDEVKVPVFVCLAEFLTPT